MAFVGSIYLTSEKGSISKIHGNGFNRISLFSGNTIYSVPKKRKRVQTPVRAITLNPQNDEVDWVIVDVAIKYGENQLQEEVLSQVEDDAKSLVRVALKDASTELSIVLCSDEEIRSMNSEWRGIDKSTDVLSFPQDDPDKVVLGDIVISVDTAQRQANDAGHSLQDELRILLVHGLLHLLGYDHEGAVEGDWLIMAQMENRLMKQLEWKGEGLVSSVQDLVYRDIVQ